MNEEFLMYIKNSSDLIENGQTRAERNARKSCLDAIEYALMSVEPSRLVKTRVKLRGDRLIADEKQINLDRFRRVLVIGGGKASGAMASAIESLLDGKITAGMINVPESQVEKNACKIIELHGATHPLPSKKGEEGVVKMLEMIGTPTQDTLVICLISGGGSSLLPMPRAGVSLSDKIEVTRNLLQAGATIGELNIVRKHLSAIKGGWLAERLYPSTVISLVISDVIGNRLESIASGPLFPDPSTFLDAVKVLKKYRVWRKLPVNVYALMQKGVQGAIPETPKPGSRYFERVFNTVIGSNLDACAAAVRRLRSRRYSPVLLNTNYEGEARDVGKNFGSLALGMIGKTRPRSYVAGGETTVSVKGNGKGGRNQELALGAALKISGNQGVAIISMGTDGIDGPTDAAGAIVDGTTVAKARSKGLRPEDFLSYNDSYHFFKELDDLVITGPTGTNVNDLCIVALN